jgi:alpha-tubulin suppressor-like RCC1 family protein
MVKFKIKFKIKFNKIKEKELFLFGYNNNKQLGIEGGDLNSITNNVLKKFKIENEKLKKIKCGNYHNLMLIEDGKSN